MLFVLDFVAGLILGFVADVLRWLFCFVAYLFRMFVVVCCC